MKKAMDLSTAIFDPSKTAVLGEEASGLYNTILGVKA
jgi:hypothetical protein